MSAELLFAIAMIADLAFVLLCFALGRDYLYAAVITNIIFANVVAPKLVTVFGLDQTASNAFYAAIFLATDLLSEHYGRRAATRAVLLGFVALVPIILFGPLVTLFTASANGDPSISQAIDTVFGWTPRIAIASLITYMIAQNVDVFLYEAIKSRLPGHRWLWLRNNGSTLFSQFIDQVLFVSLAFAFVLPFQVMLQIFVAGYIMKVVVAVSDTPFIYASHWIVRLRGGVPRTVD